MSHPAPLPRVAACVFDAYGTLFDTASVARRAQEVLGPDWRTFSDLWRARQLQYTWLRGLAGRHADFWQVTGDALDFALASVGGDPSWRQRLLEGYLAIEPYPEVPAMLQSLGDRGVRRAILSNGTPAMLQAAVDRSGLAGHFEAIFSVEEVGVFKPHPSVYRLAADRMGLATEDLCFLSSNAWDAWGAKVAGLRVLWCNRTGQPPEGMQEGPDGEIPDLAGLPDLVAPRSAGS